MLENILSNREFYISLNELNLKKVLSTIIKRNLKILQSEWLRTFWLITQGPEFSQTWDLCKHKANNMNFHLTPNSEKRNFKIFGNT